MIVELFRPVRLRIIFQRVDCYIVCRDAIVSNPRCRFSPLLQILLDFAVEERDDIFKFFDKVVLLYELTTQPACV